MAEQPRIACVVVVGGANTDIVGRPDAPLIASDSNPGHATVSSGGVARNIAENLARLDVRVELVTAFGDDHNARALERECVDAGISVAHSVLAAGVPGSVYLAILDADGDLALALSDMRALDALDAEALDRREALLADADLIVADANLAEDALSNLADAAGERLLLAAVSVAKVTRLAAALQSGVACVVCNHAEAGALLAEGAADALPEAFDADQAARLLVELGARRAVVTQGASGAAYAGEGESGALAAPAVEIVNATGAGDAFTAGVALGILEGAALAECVRLGSAMAGLALASESTVSAAVGRATIRVGEV